MGISEQGAGMALVRFDLQRTGDTAAIVIGGRLTVSQAGYLRQKLLAAFEGSRRVELALHDVQEADLSFLQLLCAAHRTAAARGVSFLLSGLETADPVLRLILEAGVRWGAGCPESCLWPSDRVAGSVASVTPKG